MKKYKYILLSIIYCLLVNTDSNSQQLDISFGNMGKVLIPIGNSLDRGQDVTILSTGDIITVGYSTNNAGTNYKLAVTDLTSAGILNTGFSSTGKDTLSFGANIDIVGNSVAALNDKIYVAGYYSDPTSSDFLIVKLNSDGSKDVTFNFTGEKSISLSAGNDYAYSIAVQPDGKIIVGGTASGKLSLLRLNADGTMDATFNSGNVVVLSGYHQANDIKIQKDGKILVLNDDFTVIRLNSDGTFNTSFGALGYASVNFGGTVQIAYSLAIQKDGNILIGGEVDSKFSIARLKKTDGSLDITFNGSGMTSFDEGGSTNICNKVVVDTFATINKIIMAGYALHGSVSNFAIARLDLIGNLEAKAIENISNGSSIAKSIAIQPDSKIVVAGYANNGIDDNFAVIRLLPDFVTTGVTEAEATINSGVNIFPNPASYQLNIHSGYNISNIIIYNVLGEQVMSVANNNDMSSVIDISSLNKGIYTAVITTDKGSAVKKVVKQ